LFDLTCIESRLLAHYPAFLPDLIIGVEFASQIPQVLARMIEIDDLNGTGKVLVGDVPDPFGSIAHHDFLLRPTPALLPGFQMG
jgi:hypothetical protein